MDSNENKLNGSLDSAMDLSPEEIEALFAQMQAESEKLSPQVDMDALFGSGDGTEDLDIQEISKLLERADNNEAVDTDILALMKSQDEEGQNAYEAMDLFSGEAEPEKKGFFARLIEGFKKKSAEKKAAKEEKSGKAKAAKEEKAEKAKAAKEEKAEKTKAAKKEKASKKNKVKKEKNQEKQLESETLFDYEKLEEAHFDNAADTMDDALALLMGGSGTDAMDTIPSIEKEPENVKAKEAVEAEAEEKPKKDKKKKNKKTKEKKPKEKKSKDKEKKVKEKKPKKDKAEKQEEDDNSSWLDEVPNKKKTSMIFAASIMVMIGFLIISYFFTRHVNNKAAEEAFEAGDYLECYQTLYNQERNEEQDLIFHRSEITLKLNLYWNKYNSYVENEMWLEGLDELVQYVYDYPKFSIYAQEWNSSDLAEGTYQQIQLILADEYDITAQDAMDIAELARDEDYTRALLKLVQKRYERMEGKKNYPDMLPQEEDKIFSN